MPMKRNRSSIRIKKRKPARLLKFSAVVLVFCYVIYLFISQGATIRANASRINGINQQLEDALVRGERLKAEREIIDTAEYKEQVARERGGMIMPDELLFIDPLEN